MEYIKIKDDKMRRRRIKLQSDIIECDYGGEGEEGEEEEKTKFFNFVGKKICEIDNDMLGKKLFCKNRLLYHI